MGSRGKDARFALLLAAVAGVWLLACTAGGISGAEWLGPLLLIATPLVCGRYLGEDLLERARLALHRPRGRRRRAPVRTPVVPAGRLVPRGTLLLATHLARRPPPAVV